MKRLLLTGLTGKSGGVFAQLLAKSPIAQEYDLRVAIRANSPAEKLKALLPQAEYCVGDLTDEPFLTPLTRDVDVLFHIAGIGKSLPLVRAAAENGVKRMVLVHTTGIYSKYKAAGEWYRQSEAEIDAIAAEQGIALTYLRPTMIYGTPADQNMIQFIRMVDMLSPMPVVNHANYLLQPVNHRDLGKAYLQVLEHLDITANKNYILSGRDPILLKDIFQLIAKDLNVERRYISVPFPVAYTGAWGLYLLSLTRIDMREKVQRLCESRDFSHEEAVRDFGYAPMPFAEGLRDEVEAYLRLKK